MIWSNNKSCNNYASELAQAAYKYIDIIGAIAKFYCYCPTEQNKSDMRRGINHSNADNERPELSSHYDAAKQAFRGNIGFCSECDDSKCAINRYEMQRYYFRKSVIILCIIYGSF